MLARLLPWLLALAFACERQRDAPDVEVEFGVFFGGQVQERSELPLVLDRTRQTHGIRLAFREPATRPLKLLWELEKPAAAKKPDAGKLVEYGEATVPAGERRFEIPLAFRAGDRPGPWRVRVTLDERVVLERAFEVVPAPPPRPAPDE